MLGFFCRNLSYKVTFKEFETKEPSLIYEDRSVNVTTIPLQHRIPCCGFLFSEKPGFHHINREMIDFYEVPLYEINRIKNGADYVTPEGVVLILYFVKRSLNRSKELIYFFMKQRLHKVNWPVRRKPIILQQNKLPLSGEKLELKSW